MQINLEVTTQKLKKTKLITRIVRTSNNNTIEIHKLSQRNLKHYQWEVKPGSRVFHHNDVYTIREVNFTDAKPSNLLLTLDRDFPIETYEVHSLFSRPIIIPGDYQVNKIFLFITPRYNRGIVTVSYCGSRVFSF